jgi:hypothetical protein
MLVALIHFIERALHALRDFGLDFDFERLGVGIGCFT